MKLGPLVLGAVFTVIVLIFLFFILRSCVRSSSSSNAASSDSTTSVSAEATSTSEHLIPCTADPVTGICDPQEKDLSKGFNWRNFMADVRASNQRVAQATPPPGGFKTVADFLAWKSNSGSTVSSRSASTRSSSNSFFDRFRSTSSSSSSSFRSGTSTFSDPSDRPSDVPPNSGSTSGDDPFIAAPIDDGSSFTSEDSLSDLNGTFQSLNSDSAYAGYSGLQGSLGPLPTSGRCSRGRSLLSLVDPADLTEGTEGSTIPVILNGDCPVTAAILKWNKQSEFGGPLDF